MTVAAAVDVSAFIHPFAHVEDASIGPRTRIWQFASVIRGAILGADCNVASTAIIDGAVFGDRCAIGHGASINPGFCAGNDVFVGPNVTCCNDMWPRVAKDGFEIRRLLLGGLVSILVEAEASIGAGAIILPGIVIGCGALIAAGAVVDRSVAAGHLFHRDRTISRIDPERSIFRMRAAQI